MENIVLAPFCVSISGQQKFGPLYEILNTPVLLVNVPVNVVLLTPFILLNFECSVVASSTVVDSIIFPMSGVIFQYISVGNSTTENIPEDKIEKKVSHIFLHKIQNTKCF